MLGRTAYLEDSAVWHRREYGLAQDLVAALAGFWSIAVQAIGGPWHVRVAPDQEPGRRAIAQGSFEQRVVIEVLNAIHGRHQRTWIAHDELIGICSADRRLEPIGLPLHDSCLLTPFGRSSVLVDEVAQFLGHDHRLKRVG